MPRPPKQNPAAADLHPYPHLKLTNEAFPRLLATRKLANDGAEYFGAFLNRTAVRILIDFLNRTFRLRTCDIDIDGSFPVPCTQYYARRCVAPCVSSLCTEAVYEASVELVRLFLTNDREKFRFEVRGRIKSASIELDFEHAAELRDLLKNVEGFWENPRWQVWLADSVDTYGFYDAGGEHDVFLISQRRRRTIGSHIFHVRGPDLDGELEGILKRMYVYHAPREIRVPIDFGGRVEFAELLSEKFGREVKIKVVREQALGVTAVRAFQKSVMESGLRELGVRPPSTVTAKKLKSNFRLAAVPKCIEAYDVAHISATSFVAAAIVHDIRERRTIEYEYLQTAEKSEPAALGELVRNRLQRGTRPDIGLILVDGGKTQLNAAAEAAADLPERFAEIVSAVKPPGRHSEISHFLTASGRRIEYDPSDSGHRLLLALRDEVHELANSVHRLTRDMSSFYELSAILPSINEATRQGLIARAGSIRRILSLSFDEMTHLLAPAAAKAVLRDLENHHGGNYTHAVPLIVPVRFDEFDGGAEDLRPILTKGRQPN